MYNNSRPIGAAYYHHSFDVYNKMIEIYGKENCPFCDRAKELCEQSGYEYNYNQLDVDFNRDELLELFPDARTFPQISVDDFFI